MDSKRSAERLTRFVKWYSLWYLFLLMIGGFLVDIRLGIAIGVTGAALAIFAKRKMHFELLARPEIERAYRAPRKGRRHFVLMDLDYKSFLLSSFAVLIFGTPGVTIERLLEASYGDPPKAFFTTSMLIPILIFFGWEFED